MAEVIEWQDRSEIFDRKYFGGGGKFGGYRFEGFWDFPVHDITAQHILSRQPSSVLEIGAARGYVLKRIQGAGIPAYGLEVSKHCYLTRVADGIELWDLCNTPWPVADKAVDLIYSIAVFEHIPESLLSDVISEMIRVSQRGLHGIDFGEKDDGFDKTHCLLRSSSFWKSVMPSNHEVVDKEELERGSANVPDDGKIKLNIGCFATMFHYGWQNLDIIDLRQFAANHSYKFQQVDVRKGLPYNTETVSLIYLSHFIEHLDYKEGLSFLRECRRVIKSDGCMRILVPDAELLINRYKEGTLAEFGEINDGCASSNTEAQRLWSLLFAGHSAAYDKLTLSKVLSEASFNAELKSFRVGHSQILRETLDLLPCLTLYMEAVPG